MSLKKIVDDYRASKELIITPAYKEWLVNHGDDPYPQWVSRMVARQLMKPPRVRQGTFSASSSGRCLREQELVFVGAKTTYLNAGVTPTQQAVYDDGDWRHLKWQANLLSAELMEEMEVPIIGDDNAYGTMDGRGTVTEVHDNKKYLGRKFGVEFKGVNPIYYNKWVKEPDPTEEHMRQVHRYFFLTGLDLFVVIYENKWTNDWHEFVVEPRKQFMEESKRELEDLNESASKKKFHAQLPACKARIGDQFTKCQFGGKGGTCEKTRSWPRAKD